MKRIGKSIFGVRHGFVLGLLFTVLLALPGISVAQQPVLVTNPVRLELTEGGTGTFTVKLDKAPSADTELRIDGDNSGDLSQHSVDPNRYTFTTTNWETEKTITVNVGHDDNADDDKKTGSDSGAWIIRFVVLDVNANNSGVTVLVTDDDEAGNIVLTPATGTLDVNEGSSATFEVHLDTLPPSTQTLSVAKTKAGLTVSPTTLTFLTTNYSTKQMVTVTGSQDNDHQDIEDTITLSVSSGDSKKYIADDVTDDDDTGGITVPSAAIVISESRTQRTGMNVKLNSAPLTGTIASINVASSDTGAATLSTNSLRFTTSTWNVNNSVGITPVNDADGTDETVTITLTPSSGYPDVAAVTKEVTIQDDDGGINISSGAVNVIEGEDGTFTVTLAAPPKQSATFSVTSGDTAVATVSPTTLTFSSTNSTDAQTVTVTGVHDADQSNETATITVAATGGYRASNATKSISVTDDDARLDVSSAAVSFAEDSTGTFTVGLTSVPSVNVTVTVSSGDTSKATVSPSPITFTSTDWDAETVTVTGVDDNDGTDDTVTISLDASGTTPDATKDVTIEDDDGEIEVSSAAVEITEGGSAGTFEVTLAHPPKTSVTLNVTSGDSGAATVSPPTLTFTSSNYDTVQDVTVTPADDSDGLDESVTITLAVSSAGGYRAADATKTISVEDDDRSIELSSAAVDLTEGGSTGSFTVALETAPAAGDDATITVSSGDTAAATVSPATLTFTSSNYDTVQTVTVTPVQDTDGLDERVAITVSSDSNYEADSVTKDISVVDDDRSIIATAASALTEGSGSTSTFDVTLETAPASGVEAELSVTSGDTAAVTVDP
ncbi:MAG: hypothetical protein ISN28_10830, partial [Ectothiorhodospiraceae bacterium AqS1]|nr:hypothetical protein [Ectothiorhodospiraceae bacterium AqS1]